MDNYEDPKEKQTRLNKTTYRASTSPNRRMNPGSKFRASAPYFVEGSRNSNREATQLHESIPYEEDHLTVNKLASDDYVTQNSGYFSVKSKISDYELQNRTNNLVKLSDYLHIDKNKKFQTIFDFFVEFRQFKFVDDIFQSKGSF